MTDQKLEELLDILRTRRETVTAAESCTGGLLSGRITDIPGSSDVFRQSFVTYCNEAKMSLLGVRRETLDRYTAVSRQTAEEMADGAARAARADAALSVTGYAGPPVSPEDIPENGHVFIGACYHGKKTVGEFRFEGNRSAVRAQAADAALEILYRLVN